MDPHLGVNGPSPGCIWSLAWAHQDPRLGVNACRQACPADRRDALYCSGASAVLMAACSACHGLCCAVLYCEGVPNARLGTPADQRSAWACQRRVGSLPGRQTARTTHTLSEAGRRLRCAKAGSANVPAAAGGGVSGGMAAATVAAVAAGVRVRPRFLSLSLSLSSVFFRLLATASAAALVFAVRVCGCVRPSVVH